MKNSKVLLVTCVWSAFAHGQTDIHGQTDTIRFVSPVEGSTYVDGSVVPIVIELDQRRITVSPPNLGSVGPDRILVRGRYSDGSLKTVSRPGSGVNYNVLNPGVVNVEEDGGLVPLSIGDTLIQVTYQNAEDWLYVNVEEQGNFLHPQPNNLEASIVIERSGFRADPVTKVFHQRLQLTNTGSVPIVSPLKLVLNGLTDGVSVSGRSWWTTELLAPIGSPGINISKGMERTLLFPGETAYVDLKFTNKNGLAINYIPIIYSSLRR